MSLFELSDEEMEEYHDAADAEDLGEACSAVFSVAEDRLSEAETPVDKQKEFNAVGSKLAEVAQRTDDHETVQEILDTTKKWVSEQSSRLGIAKKKINEQVVGELEEVYLEFNDERISEWIANQDGRINQELQLDGSGMAWDEYMETCTEVVRNESSDVVSDPTLVFKFEDETQVTIEDDKHLARSKFYRRVESASPRQIRLELSSTQLEEEIEREPDTEEYERDYRRLSHGPPERPWGLSQTQIGSPLPSYNECITHLVSERKTIQERVGSNTEAINDIQSWINSRPAVTDLEDAATESVPYYDSELEEVWIRTGDMATILEDEEATRESLVHELAEREMGSDELSRRQIVYEVDELPYNPRFWRLDATHPMVPTPEEVRHTMSGVDALNTGMSFGDDGEDGTDTDSGEGGGSDGGA